MVDIDQGKPAAGQHNIISNAIIQCNAMPWKAQLMRPLGEGCTNLTPFQKDGFLLNIAHSPATTSKVVVRLNTLQGNFISTLASQWY